MKRAWEAFWDCFAAGMEKWAADMTEYAKKLPDREYFRGYEDGLNDRPFRRGGTDG